MSRRAIFLLPLVCAILVFTNAHAQVTYTTTTVQDAFLTSGSADNPFGTGAAGLNFGAAGALAVSPASADKGEFVSVLMFNFTNAVALFNSACGLNNWTITNITLRLASNFATNGLQPNNMIFNVVSNGNFVIEWLSDDTWVEGTGNPGQPTTDGVTFDDLPALLSGPTSILCTNTYIPPGDNVPVFYTLPLDTNLLADIDGGGNATLFFYAADNQIDYLFNSREYGRGNQPLINVTATPLLQILSGNFSNGVFYLTGTGVANEQCQVQVNADLTTTNWQTLGTVTPGTNGVIQFDDTSATNQQRFYRLSQAL
jgi:hypothetical protein